MLQKNYKNQETKDIFKHELVDIIDLNHHLCIFADQFNWKCVDDYFANIFTDNTGRPSEDSRLIAGLFYLKSLYNTSDQQLVNTWRENPYWQYFCGERYFKHKLPIDPSNLSKWRRKLGSEGIEKLQEILLLFAFSSGFIKEGELNHVIADTTVQEKAITYPTDSKLYHKCREQLVSRAKELKLSLRQNYNKVGKIALVKSARYGHARQFKRMRKEIKKLKNYLGRVQRDVRRQLSKMSLEDRCLTDLLNKASSLLTQTRTSKNKLYSLHAPEVVCISKGKTHKKYEYGTKVSVVSTVKNNWVLVSEALDGNPYDGHTLKVSLYKIKKFIGITPKEVYVDKGYKGNGVESTKVYISGQKRGVTSSIKKRLKKRQAVEPIIGHLKHDHGMSRNYLRGSIGDKINALCAAIGFNLNKLLKMMTMA